MNCPALVTTEVVAESDDELVPYLNGLIYKEAGSDFFFLLSLESIR